MRIICDDTEQPIVEAMTRLAQQIGPDKAKRVCQGFEDATVYPADQPNKATVTLDAEAAEAMQRLLELAGLTLVLMGAEAKPEDEPAARMISRLTGPQELTSVHTTILESLMNKLNDVQLGHAGPQAVDLEDSEAITLRTLVNNERLRHNGDYDDELADARDAAEPYLRSVDAGLLAEVSRRLRTGYSMAAQQGAETFTISLPLELFTQLSSAIQATEAML